LKNWLFLTALVMVCAAVTPSARGDDFTRRPFGQPRFTQPHMHTVLVAADEAATPVPGSADMDKKEREPTPEEKFKARFPQPVMVGHLIGLPVLDGEDSTIGYVKEVVKDPDGRIELIVPYARRFGWAHDSSWLARNRRPVAVPIETVAILARQIDALDMERDDFDKAPTWSPDQAQPIAASEMIKIAIQRR
jgi:PRC-barrel domain